MFAPIADERLAPPKGLIGGGRGPHVPGHDRTRKICTNVLKSCVHKSY